MSVAWEDQSWCFPFFLYTINYSAFLGIGVPTPMLDFLDGALASGTHSVLGSAYVNTWTFYFHGAASGIRTHDPLFTKQLL